MRNAKNTKRKRSATRQSANNNSDDNEEEQDNNKTRRITMAASANMNATPKLQQIQSQSLLPTRVSFESPSITDLQSRFL